MEYLQFASFSENDFDEIVLNAGGKRYTDDPKVSDLNCDYILDNIVIELKIIMEEPVKKKRNRKNLLNYFLLKQRP